MLPVSDRVTSWDASKTGATAFENQMPDHGGIIAPNLFKPLEPCGMSLPCYLSPEELDMTIPDLPEGRPGDGGLEDGLRSRPSRPLALSCTLAYAACTYRGLLARVESRHSARPHFVIVATR